ncbi:MAG: S9 family peptidase [Ignavibacteria bacterium]|nr:S9 family peptidase [Ignavibacteria bacterium]
MGRKILLVLLFTSAILWAQNKSYSIEDIYKNKIYTSTRVNSFKWIPGGQAYSFVQMNPETKVPEIWREDIITGTRRVIIDAEQLKHTAWGQADPGDYQWAPDGSYILFTGVLPARKLKTGGNFSIYDFAQQKTTRLIESKDDQSNVHLSPDGKYVAFVRGNNLFVYDIASDKITQLTFDTNPEIINGKFDWVYEEEFSVIKSIEWSPDSKTVAFWHLDQSSVPVVPLQKYDSLYPYVYTYHYPKPGAPNSLVKIGMADIATGKLVWADLGNDTDIYIPRIQFTGNPEILAIQRLDRLQHKLDLLFAERKTGKTNCILTEKDTAWLNITDNWYFLSNGKKFIWQSERDNFAHLYLYNMDGTLDMQLTSGDYEVSKLLAVDEKEKKVYFTSNERGVLYSDLYSVGFNSKNKKRLTEAIGTHSISISADNRFFTDEFSNIRTPAIKSLNAIDGKKLRDLTSISNLPQDKFDFGETNFLRFTTSDGVELQAMMIKPVGFSPDKKYPVLFYNYSGPGSQSVKDQWDRQGIWHNLLAQKGYIIFIMDNRGTGGRGRNFERVVYKNLGYWEVNDLVEGAKYLQNLPYVDKNRIGIWGWSYGGYAAASAILRGSEYFKVAVAVAPVTDWRYYDDIYTERFMSLPALNPEGYKASSLLQYADRLKGKLFIIHGTADDNVHFQNSVALVEKLIDAKKQFRVMYYPEKEHSIYGGSTRQQLFTMITEFILKEL